MTFSKCRERVKMSMWWPQISSDPINGIAKCDFCQTNRRQQKAEPLSPSVLPERPKIGADIYNYIGKSTK